MGTDPLSALLCGRPASVQRLPAAHQTAEYPALQPLSVLHNGRHLFLPRLDGNNTRPRSTGHRNPSTGCPDQNQRHCRFDILPGHPSVESLAGADLTTRKGTKAIDSVFRIV